MGWLARSLHTIIGGIKMVNYEESSSKSLFRLLLKKKWNFVQQKLLASGKKAAECVGTHTKSRSLIPGYQWVKSRFMSPVLGLTIIIQKGGKLSYWLLHEYHDPKRRETFVSIPTYKWVESWVILVPLVAQTCATTGPWLVVPHQCFC